MQPSSGPPTSLSPTPQPKQPKPKGRLKKVLVYLVMVGVLTGLFWQRQNIIDWWTLRNYTPTIAATELSVNTGMTDLGQKIFYLQRPELQDKEKFYISCEEGETTVVLGCYKPGSGIFVLKVDDKRLKGVEEVTSAHEMLHAAYDRLSYSQQQNIDEQIQLAYDNLEDKAIKEKIDLYKENNADILNELHSILATEVEDLPAGLEEYYKKYFKDRKKIVAYANAYKHEFIERKEKVTALDDKLKQLEDQIAANNKLLNSKQKKIQSQSSELDVLLQSGKLDEYNTGVREYNAKLVPFRALIYQTKQLIATYKSTLAERNRLAEEAQELNMALDSRKIKTVEDIK